MPFICSPYHHPKPGTNDRTMSERLRQIDQATRERRAAYRNARIEPRWRPRYRINEQEARTPLLASAAPGPVELGVDVDWAVEWDGFDHREECMDEVCEEDCTMPAPAAKGVPNSLDFIRKRYRRDVDVDESDVDDDGETTLVDSASEDESSDHGTRASESAFEDPPSCKDSKQSFSTVATADIGALMESPSSENSFDSLADSCGSEDSNLCSSDWLMYPSSCDSDRSSDSMQSTSTIASSEIGPLMESPLSDDSFAGSCGSEDSSLCSSTWLLHPSCDSDDDCSDCRCSSKKRDVDVEY